MLVTAKLQETIATRKNLAKRICLEHSLPSHLVTDDLLMTMAGQDESTWTKLLESRGGKRPQRYRDGTFEDFAEGLAAAASQRSFY
jgi:hypothetical protein